MLDEVGVMQPFQRTVNATFLDSAWCGHTIQKTAVSIGGRNLSQTEEFGDHVNHVSPHKNNR